jgi:hypothetical protein
MDAIPTNDIIAIIDTIAACRASELVDNSYIPFVNTGSEIGELDTDILYDYYRGGLREALKQIVIKYGNNPTIDLEGVFISKVSRIALICTIPQYGDGMITRSITAPFVGVYTNQSYMSASVSCCFNINTLYVTFSGTDGLVDILTDAQFLTSPMGIDRYDDSGIMVHSGALKQARINGFMQQLCHTVVTTIRSAALLVGTDKEWTIVTQGYSLGAMHAQLFVLFMNDHIMNRNRYRNLGDPSKLININFKYMVRLLGCPIVGNLRFVQTFARIVGGTYDTTRIGAIDGVGPPTTPPDGVGPPTTPATPSAIGATPSAIGATPSAIGATPSAIGATPSTTQPTQTIDSVVTLTTMPGRVITISDKLDPVPFMHIVMRTSLESILPKTTAKALLKRANYIHIEDYILSPSRQVPLDGTVYRYDSSTLIPYRVSNPDSLLPTDQFAAFHYIYFADNLAKYHAASAYALIRDMFERFTGTNPVDIPIL